MYIYCNNSKREFLQLFQKILLMITRKIVKKGTKHTKKKYLPSFPSLSTATTRTTKKPISTFYHCRPSKYAFFHCETTKYLQNIPLENSNCQHPQICNTQGITNIIMQLKKYSF